jgi:hypothetical protein
MDKRHRRSGQSLVEFSLVLPAAFFMILLMLELFFIARTKLVLGFSADRIARAAAAQGNPISVEVDQFAKHFTVGPLWGMPLPGQISAESLPQWPAYSGLTVVKPLDQGGHLSVVDLSYQVLPKHWFMDWITVPTLGAHVELPQEPEILDP